MRSVLVLLEKRGYRPYGGAERATQLILALLADEGFNITVLTGNRNFNVGSVKCIYSPLLDVPSKVHLWRNMLRSNARNWLSEIIKKVDAVYIPRLAYPAIPLARRCEAEVIVHLHDYQPITYCSAVFNHGENCSISLKEDMKTSLQFEILENESIIKSMSSLLATPLNKLSMLWIKEANEIICVSRRQRDIIVSVAPELADKLKVIYNPLPTIPLVEKRLEDPTFMYLGGDSYVKGFYVLLDASRRILKRGQNVKFLLTRNFKDVNKRFVERLNEEFKGKYDLLGHLDYENVLKCHSISHAIIFASIWEEPLPYVVLEAMLAGTIPIASKVGGVPEIVEQSFAEKMLFEPCNVDELADRMESLLAMSKEQITDMGLSLREAVLRRFNSEVTKRKLIEVISS